MDRGKYAYVVVLLKHVRAKIPAFQKSHSVMQTFCFSSGITVSVYRDLYTFQLTALFWKSFHLRLHCYTMQNAAVYVSLHTGRLSLNTLLKKCTGVCLKIMMAGRKCRWRDHLAIFSSHHCGLLARSNAYSDRFFNVHCVMVCMNVHIYM